MKAKRRPLRTSVTYGYWGTQRTVSLFFGYLGALVALTVFFTPELIFHSYYGYLQVAAAGLLTWFTYRRAHRVQGGQGSRVVNISSRRPRSRDRASDSKGRTLH